MHELPVVKQVLDGVLKAAESADAVRIDKVVLEIGELHDLVPEWVEKFFKYASQGTIAENAEIVIERPPMICKCHSCGEYFTLKLRGSDQRSCSVCGSDDFERINGDEFSIKEIEYV